MHGEVKNMQAKFNGQKVRTLRKMKKLSQAMLAEQGDTSERYIRDLERGQKRKPLRLGGVQPQPGAGPCRNG